MVWLLESQAAGSRPRSSQRYLFLKTRTQIEQCLSKLNISLTRITGISKITRGVFRRVGRLNS